MPRSKVGKEKVPKLVTLPKNGIVYRYKFQVAGELYTGATGCNTYEAAHAYAVALRKQFKAKAVLREQASGRNPLGRRDLPLLFVADEFWRLKGSQAINAKSDEVMLRRVVELLGPKTLMTRIDDYMVAQMVADLRAHISPHTQRPYKPRSINGFLAMLRRVHTFAGEGPRGKLKLPVSPINFEDAMQQAEQRIRVMSQTEEQNMFAEGGDYAIVGRFGLACGMRRTNLITLKWSEIDFEKREIAIIQKRNQRNKIIRPHIIHMTAWMEKTLRDQLPYKDAGQGQVWTYAADRTQTNRKAGVHFVKGQRYPMRVWGFWSWYKSRAARLGLDLTVHDLRRSTGSRVLSTTGSIAYAQRILGHADPSITARVYAHALPDDLRAAMDRIQGAFC